MAISSCCCWFRALATRSKGACSFQLALAQYEQGRAAVARGGLGEADEGVGDALHRRHDGGLPGLVGRQQQVGDMADSRGIGQGTAAELVCAGAQSDR
jgi:hypothetical protein